jgi:hypothetical protein
MARGIFQWITTIYNDLDRHGEAEGVDPHLSHFSVKTMK